MTKPDMMSEAEWNYHIRWFRTLIRVMKSRKEHSITLSLYDVEEWIEFVEELKDYAFDRNLHHL